MIKGWVAACFSHGRGILVNDYNLVMAPRPRVKSIRISDGILTASGVIYLRLVFFLGLFKPKPMVGLMPKFLTLANLAIAFRLDLVPQTLR